ncbi:MAG TPA: type 1 glutamine amidotransferase [Solirubrobacteraceae bacterium]|jgi:GMP synthase-like glutamine amidotransferase|nr:type 1 glutamine amidotransferase [Solirubrobacteraceae bacterium]
MRLLVIQHIACEPPGAYEDEMLRRGIAFDRVQIDEGQALPDWRGYQGIVAMGGPMSANDEQELPWLAGEKRAIAEAVRAGMSYWGVCLGAQLLAASLGARVYRGAAPELGIYDDLALTQDALRDPLFADLPSQLSTFQWHGETFELPDGATRLAGSRAYANQAFVWRRAYALQFHIEVSSDLARRWLELPAYTAELTAADGNDAVDALSARLNELDRIVPIAHTLFSRFIDTIVQPSVVH